MKKAQNGLASKVVKKVGNTKIKDIPEKAVRVTKRVGSKLLDKLPEAAETTANALTAGYYSKAKKGLGLKNGGKVKKVAGYKAGGKMGKCKGGC